MADFLSRIRSLTMLSNSGNDQRRPPPLQRLQTGTTRVYGSGRDFLSCMRSLTTQ